MQPYNPDHDHMVRQTEDNSLLHWYTYHLIYHHTSINWSEHIYHKPIWDLLPVCHLDNQFNELPF